MIVQTTNRLILREFKEEDAQSLFELNNDPDVLKFTGDKPFQNIQEAKRFIQKYDHYDNYGFGRWAVILKENNEFLGWCGLKYTPEKNEHDIGFRFLKHTWNQGFATEAAIACLDLGFYEFELTKIVGRAMKENQASIRVLEKTGLKFEKPFDFDGNEGLIYAIENQTSTPTGQ